MALELPGYRFVEKIGEGGMATVYLGVQESLQRPVAIKVLSAQMRQQGEVRDAFERESLIVARLAHPNIVSVIDRGVSERGTPYFIMEFVDGVDLSRVLAEGQLGLNRKLELVLQVAKALAYAHRNGVIHRDIKPGNILVDKDWHVRVVDFGIAHMLRDARSDSRAGCGVAETSPSIMGTEAYMAPELQQGEVEASVRSDLYSLGVILFELLTGRRPDGSPTPPSALAEAIPRELDLLVLKCLAPDPKMRPQRAEQVCDALLELLHGAHLDNAQKQRAEATLNKKSFALLDVWREASSGAVYLFLERKTGRRYVVRKSSSIHQGYGACSSLSGLEHPHLVKVHGVSKNNRAFIAVLEYMPGGSLQERMARPFELNAFLPVAIQMCQGLAFAHGRGVVHGFLRPSSVLFDQLDNVRVADFGWPSLLGDKALQVAEADSDFKLLDEPREQPLDVYACGAIFYRMLVGDWPRYSRGQLSAGAAFKRLPEALRQLLKSMLSQEPSARPESLLQVVGVLDGLGDNLPTQVWSQQVVDTPAPSVNKEEGQQKEMLLFLLLILLFLVLVNTGVIAVFEGWPMPFGESLRELLLDWLDP
ncbi:MAG: hypothetical protein AseanaTS_22300 [Candidatus Pelagadaptatus aseana]|uniref:protein kinase domain-containing protein n=1 Tax=Candidatus Pelagadaptatus aseana TaxID=3120508 RepID=UPI0039B24EAC